MNQDRNILEDKFASMLGWMAILLTIYILKSCFGG